MADSPCTKCGEKCNGKLFFAYANYYEEQELIKRRLRLCQACVFDFFAPLIEFADRQSNFGNWIPAEDEKPWPHDARSAITEVARLANVQSNQSTKTTATSIGAENTASNVSAEHAGLAPQSAPSESSPHSKKQESNGLTSQASNGRSTTASSSASKPRSSSSARLKTKSTGS